MKAQIAPNLGIDEKPAISNGPLDIADVTTWLRNEVRWPAGAALHGVRLRRFWARSKGRSGIEFELRINQQGLQRTVLLQGGSGPAPSRFQPHDNPILDKWGLTGLALASPTHGLWLCTPDRDPYLSVVRKLCQPDELHDLLRGSDTYEHLLLNRGQTRLTCRIVAYRAGKRCVARIRSNSGNETRGAYAKVFRRPPSDEELKTIRELRNYLDRESNGKLQLPRILDVLPAHRMVITEEVGGTKPNRETSRKTWTQHASAGQALAILHAAPLRAHATHGPSDELETVRRWLSTLERTGFEDSSLFERILEKLEVMLPTVQPTGATLLHRDFYDAQLVSTEAALWILDFDTLANGHPELDLSTYLAHLFLKCGLAGTADDVTVEMAGAFLNAYRADGGRVDEPRMRFYLPCALARLGAIHRMRGVAISTVEKLWAVAWQSLHVPIVSTSG